MADALGTATAPVSGVTDAANPLSLVGGQAVAYVQKGLQFIVSKGQGLVDKWLPPEKRSEWWARFTKFAEERPKFAAFLLSHIAISGLPLGLFILLTITVAVFAIIVALLIALLGAVLFIVFAVGVALIFLLPTLFFTTLAATFLFLWGLGVYYLLKWFNEKKIPGIHTGLVEGLKTEFMEFTEPSELDKLPSLKAADGVESNSQGNSQESAQSQESSAEKEKRESQQQNSSGDSKKDREGTAAQKEHQNQNGKPKGSQKQSHANGAAAKPPKLPAQDQVDSVAKTTGVDAGAATKNVSALKQTVPGGIV